MIFSPKKGFTLIEIVIVLAIAALIIVIVFFAIAGVQRTQRDVARKRVGSLILTMAVQYSSNHSGSMPASLSDMAPYSTLTTDPSGVPYDASNVIYATTQQAASSSQLIVMATGLCDGDEVKPIVNALTFAVSVYQEIDGAVCIST